MAFPIFCAASDIHLEPRPYVDYPEFCGDAYEAFRQVVDAAVSRSVPLVLAGDVFERDLPDSVTLRAAFRGVHQCAVRNLPVWYIEGQHDYAPGAPWLSLLPGARELYPDGPVRLGNFNCVGLRYTPANALKDAMAKVHKEADILVLHQPWLEFMGSHLPSDGSLAELVPPWIKMVITGDFHVHKHLVLDRPSGPLVVLSPGSTTLQSVKEDPVKYIYVVNDDLSFSSIRLVGRPVFRQTLNVADDPASVVASLRRCTDDWNGSNEKYQLPPQLHKPVWVVRIHAAVSAASVTKISEAASGQAHLFIRPFGQAATTPEDSSQPRCDDFASAMAKAGIRHDSVAGRAALQLWTAKSPDLELESIVTEWLSGPSRLDMFGGAS